MSAGDLDPSCRNRSGRGRGHFSAVANVAGDAQGLTPRSDGEDLISFEDLGDADPQRLRSVFPAPASSVGSAVRATKTSRVGSVWLTTGAFPLKRVAVTSEACQNHALDALRVVTKTKLSSSK